MVENEYGVLIADAHPLARQGLLSLLAQHSDGWTIEQAHDADTAIARLVADGSIRLLIVDDDLPGLGAAAGLRDIRTRFPAVLVVVVATTRCRTRVLEALGAGVHGYILKESPTAEMLRAIRIVAAGHIYVPTLVTDIHPHRSDTMPAAPAPDASLTDRQNEVLGLLSRGHTNKEIARLLKIAEGTVKVHVAAAFRSLGVHNRVSAVAVIQSHMAAALGGRGDGSTRRDATTLPAPHGHSPLLVQAGNAR